jgi:hypothetical protein
LAKNQEIEMPGVTASNVKIRLPGILAKHFSSREILTLLLDKAVNKSEYYSSKCKELEQKYGTDFASFKKRIEESEHESFSGWDDLLLWEGYELTYREWKKKYEDIMSCME